MSTAMTVSIPGLNLPSTEVAGNYDDLTKGAAFLPQVMLFSSGKNILQGLIRPGRFGIKISDKEIQDLGDSIDVIPLARRPKAMDFSDREAIVTNYEDSSDEFKRIQATSAEQESGCMYGISFLVFERNSGKFLEYFFSSKSSRPEAKNVYPFLPKQGEDGQIELSVITIKANLIEKPKFSWHVPVVHKCSTPITNIPVDQIGAEIEKFVNAKSTQIEVVDKKAGGRKR